MSVTIKADTVQMERKLQTLVNKQLAFAAAVAATKTAVEVRDNYVLPAYRKAFEARNKPFERSSTTSLRLTLDQQRPRKLRSPRSSAKTLPTYLARPSAKSAAVAVLRPLSL